MRRRIAGAIIDVPVVLAFLAVAATMPIVAWTAAALAMVVNAMALPERYDIACGAYAFTLIITLAVVGEIPSRYSPHAWETLLGGALGLGRAALLFPLHEQVTRIDRRCDAIRSTAAHASTC